MIARIDSLIVDNTIYPVTDYEYDVKLGIYSFTLSRKPLEGTHQFCVSDEHVHRASNLERTSVIWYVTPGKGCFID